jgi:hypothetical protein
MPYILDSYLPLALIDKDKVLKIYVKERLWKNPTQALEDRRVHVQHKSDADVGQKPPKLLSNKHIQGQHR